MDREITFALFIATTATVLIGSFYFPDGATPTTANDRMSITYAPDDIRYPLQQAERKALERKQRSNANRSERAGNQRDGSKPWVPAGMQEPTPTY